MKILVTGAGFSNTGALAMMNTLVTEIKSRFPASEIVVANSAKEPKSHNGKHEFEYVETGVSEYCSVSPMFDVATFWLKNIIKMFLGRKTESLRKFEKIIKDCDMVLDISGYALSSKWSYFNNVKFLSRIELAKKYGKPIFLLPQSFGPFNYSGKSESLINRLKEDLKYPICIYAREQQGYELLTKELKLTNVKKSSDIVLQSKIDDKGQTVSGIFDIPKESVAIVPNIHCYSYKPSALIKFYSNVISYLLKEGKTIYVVRHSNADLEVCTKIKACFEHDERVILFGEMLDNRKFSAFIKRFQYLIASRYHSIVHSYKMSVPCFVIGWADKYVELMETFGQLDYFIHIDNIEGSSVQSVSHILKTLENNLESEKAKITKQLSDIEKDNVFNDLEEYIRRTINV